MTGKKLYEGNTMAIYSTNDTVTQLSRRKTLRLAWLTPCLLGTFFLTALTGVLLFFRLDLGLVKPAHEWIGWLLLTLGLVHLLVHQRVCLQSLQRPSGKAMAFCFLFLTLMVFIPVKTERSKRPFDAIAGALVQSPLQSVAMLANQDPQDTVRRLKEQGITPWSTGQTIAQIAEYNHKPAMEVLRLIFQ